MVDIGYVYEYKIGLISEGIGAMVNVEWIAPAPMGCNYKPYSSYATTVSGQIAGDGFPVCDWIFDYITRDQLNALMEYLESKQSNTVYIQTRDDEGTFRLYTAIMYRPRAGDEKTHEFLGWRDVKIHFTYLQEVEE